MNAPRPKRMNFRLGPGVTRLDIIRALRAADLPVQFDRTEMVVVRVPDHIRREAVRGPAQQ